MKHHFLKYRVLKGSENNCQTSDLGLKLEVDFVFPLSQEQEAEEEEQQQQHLTKIYRIELN